MDNADKRMLIVALAVVLITILVIKGGADDGSEFALPQIEERYQGAENAPVVVPLPPEENYEIRNQFEEVWITTT